jgi:hypothetical protein
MRIHVPGGFFHVTLRGNHCQPIFPCTSRLDDFSMDPYVHFVRV